jgi:hypothetical protein
LFPSSRRCFQYLISCAYCIISIRSLQPATNYDITVTWCLRIALHLHNFSNTVYGSWYWYCKYRDISCILQMTAHL